MLTFKKSIKPTPQQMQVETARLTIEFSIEATSNVDTDHKLGILIIDKSHENKKIEISNLSQEDFKEFAEGLQEALLILKA